MLKKKKSYLHGKQSEEQDGVLSRDGLWEGSLSPAFPTVPGRQAPLRALTHRGLAVGTEPGDRPSPGSREAAASLSWVRSPR